MIVGGDSPESALCHGKEKPGDIEQREAGQKSDKRNSMLNAATLKQDIDCETQEDKSCDHSTLALYAHNCLRDMDGLALTLNDVCRVV